MTIGQTLPTCARNPLVHPHLEYAYLGWMNRLNLLNQKLGVRESAVRAKKTPQQNAALQGFKTRSSPGSRDANTTIIPRGGRVRERLARQRHGKRKVREWKQ